MAEIVDELCGVISGQNKVIDRQNDVIHKLCQILALHLAADEYEELVRHYELGTEGGGSNE